MSDLRAVAFDLFGTLVPEFATKDWDAHFSSMADVLGVDEAAFRRGWEATALERQLGALGDIEGNIRAICAGLGHDVTDDQVDAAASRRMEIYDVSFHPRPQAEETLGWLQANGYPTAVVSMCAPDTPALWRASPLAPVVGVEVFSCEVGLAKPEPAIYLRAIEGLGIGPDACLYVGDGSFRELSGAAAVGMHPVLIVDPAEVPGSVSRFQVEDDWDGLSISSLGEVPGLLGR